MLHILLLITFHQRSIISDITRPANEIYLQRLHEVHVTDIRLDIKNANFSNRSAWPGLGSGLQRKADQNSFMKMPNLYAQFVNTQFDILLFR